MWVFLSPSSFLSTGSTFFFLSDSLVFCTRIFHGFSISLCFHSSSAPISSGSSMTRSSELLFLACSSALDDSNSWLWLFHFSYGNAPVVVSSIVFMCSASNLKYCVWIRHDQFLLIWMLASIGKLMFGNVVRCSSAREVWAILDRLSFSQSKAHTMQLGMALQTSRKWSLLIE